MKRRVLTLLPELDFRRLEQWADQEERTASQQAAWLLRQKLAERTDGQDQRQPAAVAR
jgi:hypothetical protein